MYKSASQASLSVVRPMESTTTRAVVDEKSGQCLILRNEVVIIRRRTSLLVSATITLTGEPRYEAWKRAYNCLSESAFNLHSIKHNQLQ